MAPEEWRSVLCICGGGVGGCVVFVLLSAEFDILKNHLNQGIGNEWNPHLSTFGGEKKICYFIPFLSK